MVTELVWKNFGAVTGSLQVDENGMLLWGLKTTQDGKRHYWRFVIETNWGQIRTNVSSELKIGYDDTSKVSEEEYNLIKYKDYKKACAWVKDFLTDKSVLKEYTEIKGGEYEGKPIEPHKIVRKKIGLVTL